MATYQYFLYQISKFRDIIRNTRKPWILALKSFVMESSFTNRSAEYKCHYLYLGFSLAWWCCVCHFAFSWKSDPSWKKSPLKNVNLTDPVNDQSVSHVFKINENSKISTLVTENEIPVQNVVQKSLTSNQDRRPK